MWPGEKSFRDTRRVGRFLACSPSGMCRRAHKGVAKSRRKRRMIWPERCALVVPKSDLSQMVTPLGFVCAVGPMPTIAPASAKEGTKPRGSGGLYGGLPRRWGGVPGLQLVKFPNAETKAAPTFATLLHHLGNGSKVSLESIAHSGAYSAAFRSIGCAPGASTVAPIFRQFLQFLPLALLAVLLVLSKST
eukprot:354436-Chlamydomonas_euryale.AAC.1